MLVLRVRGEESAIEYADGSVEITVVGGYRLELEHSLVSLSKWESKHKKPFLTEEPKTPEEIIDYIRAMAIDPEVPEEIFQSLTEDHLKQINEYMNDSKTATWFRETPTNRTSSEVITSELIYYWLSGFGLPIEMENWHLNRLFTTLKVANLKSQPAKKKSKSEVYAEMRRANEERRRRYEAQGTEGA